MRILSNGSKWYGQEPDGVHVLLAHLNDGVYTLDPTFEDYGNFYGRHDGEYMVHGNFSDLSHVFDIRGTKEEIEPLRRAIRKHQRSEKYQAVRLLPIHGKYVQRKKRA